MEGSSVQSNSRLGTVDIHFTSTAVHGTLILERELEEADLTKLIEQIDEDLVLSADMPRDDFLVSVYVGKDVGFYSDEYFAEETENGAALVWMTKINQAGETRAVVFACLLVSSIF